MIQEGEEQTTGPSNNHYATVNATEAEAIPQRNSLDDETSSLGNILDEETTPLLDQEYRELEEHAAGDRLYHRKKERKQFWIVLCILVVNMLERLSFYGVAANLVPFLGLMHLRTPSPTTISLAFSGACFFTPIFGGLLADAKFGRFNTIFGAVLVYLLGNAFLCASTYREFDHPSGQYLANWAQTVLLGIALVLISVGTGGVKANLSPFGADQVCEGGGKAVANFFTWFYWFIQIGILLACTVVAYLQQEKSFFYGFIVTSCSILIATVLFLFGRNSYTIYPPVGSFLMEACKIIWSAVKATSFRGSETQEGGSCLDRAKMSRGGRFPDIQVEDLKLLLKIVPVFLTLIVYWTMYAQVLTSYLIQGIHMKLVLPNNFTVPVASLNAFEAIAVSLMIPLMDRVIYPLLTRFGLRLTPLRKVGVGMLCAAASVGVAAWVEVERKRVIIERGYFKQDPFSTHTKASYMNIFYQVPQYILLGTSEVLVAVTGLEFAYSESPRYVHGVVIGVYLAMIGAGFFLASALVAVVSKLSHSQWYPVDINHGSLEKYFSLLVGLMLANFLVFLAVSVRYGYTSFPSRTIQSDRPGNTQLERRRRHRTLSWR